MAFDLWAADLRAAWRRTAGRPAFSALVAATLALGFGAAGGVFAVLDAALWRPLPYRDASRLVFVWQTLPSQNVFELETTPADYEAWHRVSAFSSMAMLASESYTLAGRGSAVGEADAERVHGTRMTASLLPLLGLAPRLGRAFEPSEDASGAEPVVILGDGLWRRRYGADRSIVGRRIDVDGLPHRVVGVMPPDVAPPGSAARATDLWLPMRMTPDERTNAISHNYVVLARLADGITVEAASSAMVAAAAAIAQERPDSHTGVGVRLVPVSEDAVRTIRPTLAILALGAVLLALIAVANAATLLMVRASDRAHDAAVRAALGATGLQLLSLTMTEALALSAIGAVGALIVASRTAAAIEPMLAAALPIGASPAVTIRVAVVTVAAALTSGVVVGLLAGWRSTVRRHPDVLRGGARASAAPAAARARSALVVAQVALAVVLLTVGGLLVRSVDRLAHVSPGFSTDRLLTLRLSLDRSTYASADSRVSFLDELRRRLDAPPIVERVGVTSSLPLGGSRGANGVEIEGHPAPRGRSAIIDQRHVTPDYFRTLGISIVRGRAFTASDDARGEPVALVNRTAAARYFGAADPIGARVRIQAGFDSAGWIRIVGIVDDVRHVSLSRAPVPEMYRPYAQAPTPDVVVAIKTRGAPEQAAALVRSAMRSMNPSLPMYDVRSMADRVAGSFAQVRATMLLLTVTATLAAALAAVAIYGSIWYAVAQQVPEIGLRLALGAPPARVGRQVIVGALALAAAGLGIGLAGAAPAASLLGGQLFETKTTDPLTYATVVVAIGALTTAASLLPARRAMRVDPIVALRSM